MTQTEKYPKLINVTAFMHEDLKREQHLQKKDKTEDVVALTSGL